MSGRPGSRRGRAPTSRPTSRGRRERASQLPAPGPRAAPRPTACRGHQGGQCARPGHPPGALPATHSGHRSSRRTCQTCPSPALAGPPLHDPLSRAAVVTFSNRNGGARAVPRGGAAREGRGAPGPVPPKLWGRAGGWHAGWRPPRAAAQGAGWRRPQEGAAEHIGERMGDVVGPVCLRQPADPRRDGTRSGWGDSGLGRVSRRSRRAGGQRPASPDGAVLCARFACACGDQKTWMITTGASKPHTEHEGGACRGRLVRAPVRAGRWPEDHKPAPWKGPACGPCAGQAARPAAEDARFELARGCPQHAFQACALGH